MSLQSFLQLFFYPILWPLSSLCLLLLGPVSERFTQLSCLTFRVIKAVFHSKRSIMTEVQDSGWLQLQRDDGLSWCFQMGLTVAALQKKKSCSL